jgi:hypothetical protein
MNAGTKEQDALLLADGASDQSDDVVNFQVMRRHVTPPSIGVRDVASAYSAESPHGKPKRFDPVTQGTSRPRSKPETAIVSTPQGR